MSPSRPAGKTPFEIRLDLLILANEILIAKHAAAAMANYSGSRGPTTAATSEEVIAEAAKLNGFVSNNTTTPQH
jgi:hypothetical protein